MSTRTQKNRFFSPTVLGTEKARAPLEPGQNSASYRPITSFSSEFQFLEKSGFVPVFVLVCHSAPGPRGELLNTSNSQKRPLDSEFDLKNSPLGP